MSFTHPWAIWIGIFAAAVPVLIHWLTRPRPRRMPLSTLRFVLQAVQQRRSRNRLRDWIILLLRTAAILMIALAVARPRLGRLPSVAEDEAGDAVRVVVLDVSQSMAVREGVSQTLQRGRTTAAQFLRYRPGLGVNLILAAAQPRAVFPEVSTNFEALRDALAEAQPCPERLDVRRCLEMAAEMLLPASPEDKRRRELVLVSDFQRSNWTRADFSLLPEGTRIHLESVASEEQPKNFAVLRASATSVESGGPTVRLEAEVGNFSPARELLPLVVAIGDHTWRFDVDCQPGQTTTLVEELEVRDSGWQTGSVRLVSLDDCLPADNVRGLVVELRGAPRYALITRQPPQERPSASHYLQCALLPDQEPGGGPDARLTRIDPDEIDVGVLGASDLVLLARPGRLSPGAIRLLEEMLRRGRPILYLASDASDAQNLALLAGDQGVPMPVEFVPAASAQSLRGRTLGQIATQAGPFRILGDQWSETISQLRFNGGLVSRRRERGLQDDVLAAYGDGSACLVLTSSEAGNMAVLNADLDASNLPRSPVFVLMIGELVGQLTGRESSSLEAYCGESSVVHLPAQAAAVAELRIAPSASDSGAGGEASLGQLIDSQLGVAWHWPSPGQPGTYEVCHGDSAVFALAVNLPPEESRLECLSEEVLTERLGTGRQVSHRGAHARQPLRDDLWSTLLAVCVVLLIAEVVSLLSFRT